jgi:hypothetical protein
VEYQTLKFAEVCLRAAEQEDFALRGPRSLGMLLSISVTPILEAEPAQTTIRGGRLPQHECPD